MHFFLGICEYVHPCIYACWSACTYFWHTCIYPFLVQTAYVHREILTIYNCTYLLFILSRYVGKGPTALHGSYLLTISIATTITITMGSVIQKRYLTLHEKEKDVPQVMYVRYYQFKARRQELLLFKSSRSRFLILSILILLQCNSSLVFLLMANQLPLPTVLLELRTGNRTRM